MQRRLLREVDVIDQMFSFNDIYQCIKRMQGVFTRVWREEQASRVHESYNYFHAMDDDLIYVYKNITWAERNF